MNKRMLKWLAAGIALITLAILAGVYSPVLSGQTFSLVGSTASVAGCKLITTTVVVGHPLSIHCDGAALELRTTTSVIKLKSPAVVPCNTPLGSAMLVARRKEGVVQIPIRVIASPGPECL